MKRSMKLFMIAIAVVGFIRFLASISGMPNSIVRFISMTVVILAGTLYFAVNSASHKERLKDAFLLIIPYMLVEVAALAYTWATGRPTIFHAEEYSMGTSIGEHTVGHLVGGLTWEPLAVFLLMELFWLIYTTGRRFRRAA